MPLIQNKGPARGPRALERLLKFVTLVELVVTPSVELVEVCVLRVVFAVRFARLGAHFNRIGVAIYRAHKRTKWMSASMRSDMSGARVALCELC